MTTPASLLTRLARWKDMRDAASEIEHLRAALEAIEMESRDGAQWGFAEINECARIALRMDDAP